MSNIILRGRVQPLYADIVELLISMDNKQSYIVVLKKNNSHMKNIFGIVFASRLQHMLCSKGCELVKCSSYFSGTRNPITSTKTA